MDWDNTVLTLATAAFFGCWAVHGPPANARTVRGGADGLDRAAGGGDAAVAADRRPAHASAEGPARRWEPSMARPAFLLGAGALLLSTLLGDLADLSHATLKRAALADVGTNDINVGPSP